jgi:hypothetical protein
MYHATAGCATGNFVILNHALNLFHGLVQDRDFQLAE